MPAARVRATKGGGGGGRKSISHGGGSSTDLGDAFHARREARIKREKEEEALRKSMPGMPAIRIVEPEPDEEEEKEYVPMDRHKLSRKPPSRRLYRDLSQEPILGEPKTAGEVLNLWRKNKLFLRAQQRPLERVEDDKWLKEGTAGKWFKASKKKDETDEYMEEEVEKIALKLNAEEATAMQGEDGHEFQAPYVPTWSLHDYTAIQATNYTGPMLRKQTQQYVAPLYARFGQTKFAEATFQPGGLLEANQGLYRSLGVSRSEIKLPKFSTAGDASAYRALVNIARVPTMKALMHTTL